MQLIIFAMPMKLHLQTYGQNRMKQVAHMSLKAKRKKTAVSLHNNACDKRASLYHLKALRVNMRQGKQS